MALDQAAEATQDVSLVSPDAPASGPPPAASPSNAPVSTPAAPAEDLSVVEWATSKGFDLSGYPNDEAALQALLEMSRGYPQLQRLARYGQEVLPQWDRYQQWLAAGAPQQAQQAPQAPKATGPWNPPIPQSEAEKLLSRWYTRDPNGGIQPRQDAPPSVVQKVADYQQYVSDFETRLRHNPIEALKPFVQEQAKELFQQEYQQREVQRQAQEVVNRHANWMFHTDPQTGVPQPGRYTPQGLRFWQYVQQLEQSGVKDVAQQEYYALSMVQRDMLDAQRQQPQQQQPPSQRTTPQQPSRAARQPSVTPPTPAMPKGGMSLEQLALQNIRAAGMTV